MITVKTLAKGQIVIPAEIRNKYHIKPGTELQIREYNGIICLIPQSKDPIRAAQGSLPAQPSLSDLLLRLRKGDSKCS